MSDSHTKTLRIGTRGSPLALIQAEAVRDALLAAHSGLDIEIVVVRTTGDRVQDRTLADIGGKGLFTKEIEDRLLDGSTDLAVHSVKDMETVLPQGLMLGAVLRREDPRDAFISRDGTGIASLPSGAVIGTASIRRQAQILARRPDLEIRPFRGNVETRLRKLDEGEAEATMLAMAGLNRLGRPELATEVLEPSLLLPAVGQGAVGIEIRTDDEAMVAYLAAIGDARTAAEVAAERALLAELDGTCRTPIAALARVDDDGGLMMKALIAKPDGSVVHETERAGLAADAEAIGRDAGSELKAKAGPDFLA